MRGARARPPRRPQHPPHPHPPETNTQTHKHTKKQYCLPNGDAGIIRTLDAPLYLTRAAGGVVHALDRDGKARTLQVDGTEYAFKVRACAWMRACRVCERARRMGLLGRREGGGSEREREREIGARLFDTTAFHRVAALL